MPAAQLKLRNFGFHDDRFALRLSYTDSETVSPYTANYNGNTDEVYAYDAAGNVIGNQRRNITSIHYDSRNLAHLIATETGFHRYSYDDPSAMLRTSAGLRIGKHYKSENDPDWTVKTRYARGAFGEILAQYDDDQLQYWNILAGGDDVLGRMDSSDETRYYYLKDHLGSVRVTIDDEGDIVGYDDYFPFGMQMSGRSWNQGNVFDDQKFTGHFLESEGGLGIYHAGARLYDPEVPRFYGVDAMRSEMPGWNPYHYTFNNPVKYVDPDGNAPWLFGGIIGGVLEAGSQVAVGMAQGQSFSEAVSNIDGGKVLVSAATGALTGGLSVARNASALGNVGRAVGANMAEGAAHKAIDGDEITIEGVAIDAGIGALGGMAGNYASSAARNSATGQSLERTARTSERYARNAESGSNRQGKVNQRRNQANSDRRTATNYSANRGNAAGTATTKGVSTAGSTASSAGSASSSQNVITNSNSSTPADNTRVATPIRRDP